MSRSTRPRDRDAFQIAIICALDHERDAVGAVFDEIWDFEEGFGRALGDKKCIYDW